MNSRRSLRPFEALAALALAVAWGAPAAHGQQWSRELTAFLDAQAGRDGVSVAALAVTTGDSILYVHSIGGVTDSDPFVIGSLAKSVTATAVIRLHRQGRIDLAAPATDYLPDVPTNATVRELLNQRSGFERRQGHQPVSGTGGLSAGPSGSRGKFAYSNVNYTLLGRIIETVTDRPYARVIEEAVFTPLRMSNSSAGPEPLPGLTPGRKTWFWWDTEAPYVEPEQSQIPAAFIQTSLADLASFVQEHMREGTASVLGLELDEFALLHRPPDGEDTGYAMGWVAGRWTGTRSLQHSGMTAAYSSMMVALPDEDLGVLLLTASNSFTARNHLMDGALHIVRGEPPGTYHPIERYFRLLALGGLLVAFASFVRYAAAWVRRGSPLGRGTAARGGVLALRLGFSGALLLGVPYLMSLPLRDLVAMQPDLGLALVAGAVLGAFEAVTRYWLESNPDVGTV